MSQQTEIIKAEPASVTPINRTPMELINVVVERGQGLDQLSKLMELHQDFERYEAEKAFFKAMAGFQADPPEVFKNKSVAFGKTKYEHATLDHVVDEIRAKMKSHGLTFIWDLDDLDMAPFVARASLGTSWVTQPASPCLRRPTRQDKKIPCSHAQAPSLTCSVTRCSPRPALRQRTRCRT